MKIKTTFLVVLIGFFSLVLSIKAYAAIVILVQGVREVTIGSDFVDYGTVPFSVDTVRDSGYGTFGPDGIIIDDMDASVAQWTLSVTSSDFTASSGIDLPYTQQNFMADDDNTIDVIAGTSDATGVSLTTGDYFFSGSGPVSDPLTIIAADSRSRIATYQIFPRMYVRFPAGTLSGSYTNTLTFTFEVN